MRLLTSYFFIENDKKQVGKNIAVLNTQAWLKTFYTVPL